MEPKQLKLSQIITAKNKDGHDVLVGLKDDGSVWVFTPSKQGWQALFMNELPDQSDAGFLD